jgi:hypothetical protein
MIIIFCRRCTYLNSLLDSWDLLQMVSNIGFVTYVNPSRIHIRHDHKNTLSRIRMLMMPEPDVDFEASIAARVDGAPTDQIREVTNTNITLNNNLVLLNSPS